MAKRRPRCWRSRVRGGDVHQARVAPSTHFSQTQGGTGVPASYFLTVRLPFHLKATFGLDRTPGWVPAFPHSCFCASRETWFLAPGLSAVRRELNRSVRRDHF